MMLRPDQSMREHLTWVQWWAFPWKCAHEDWRGDKYRVFMTLYHCGQSAPISLTGVAPCLPPAPHPTVLRLALASTEQLNLAMALVHNTFSPQAATLLSDSHHLWCLRLSKAFPPAMLSPDADPLQLLHNWVDPDIWKRLRLRFPRERVREVERINVPIEKNAVSRLNTLWQAVAWRATARATDQIHPEPGGEETNDVMPIHN